MRADHRVLPGFALLLVLAACRTPPTSTDAGPATTSSAAETVDAAPPAKSTEFASAGTIHLQLQKYIPLEFLAHGSWVALSPKGEHAIVGTPGKASLFPGDKTIPGAEPSNAGFSSDGKRFFLIHPGATFVTNEVTVHATSDQHLLAKLTNALDVSWASGDLVFDRDGQVFRLKSGETEAKLVGPPTPAFKERPKAVAIAPSLESMIVVDQGPDRRVNGVRRVALTTSGRDLPLITSDVISKLSKNPEPLVVVSPNAARVCVLGTIRTETTVWCAADDTPVERIASFVDSGKGFSASFVGPDVLSYRLPSSGTVGIADFKARTSATMTIPGGTAATDLTPLPGGKLAVARDFFRLGIVDIAEKKFTPIGDDKASPKSVAGLATDDSVFAVAGSSLADGLGVFKVNVK